MDRLGRSTQCFLRRGGGGVEGGGGDGDAGWWEGLQEAAAAAPVRKNTSTLLQERTEIFRSLIFISLLHTLDVRMDRHADGGPATTKGFVRAHARP